MNTYTRALGARYYVEEIAPAHRRSGVPDEAIEWMGERYLSDIAANAEAQRQIVEHFADQPRPAYARDAELAIRLERGGQL